MNSKFLVEMFSSLNKNNVDYLILRGYQNLPKSYSHDLDFSVKNKSELRLFFNVIKNLSYKYKFSISRDIVRVGLIKVLLNFKSEILKIDVFYTFQYAGLEYIDIDDLHISKRVFKENIFIPKLNYELAISLLKEILHNSRIRKDKLSLLRSQYDKLTFNEPFIKYFSKRNIDDLSNALNTDGKLVFKRISFYFRIILILKNIKTKGFFTVTKRFTYFFYVKYFCQSKYDKIINN